MVLFVQDARFVTNLNKLFVARKNKNSLQPSSVSVLRYIYNEHTMTAAAAMRPGVTVRNSHILALVLGV